MNDRLFFRWAVMYQNQIDFDEFVASFRKAPDRPAEEILEDVYGYIEQFNKGMKHGDL